LTARVADELVLPDEDVDVINVADVEVVEPAPFDPPPEQASASALTAARDASF
jgi:hypothetical protein